MIRLIWEPERNGTFSAKSLHKCLISSSFEMSSDMSFVWLKIAPPKVETLVWLINCDRVCTKACYPIWVLFLQHKIYVQDDMSLRNLPLIYLFIVTIPRSFEVST